MNSLESSQRSGLEIAIIGIAGRFPGAKDTERFWHNLQNGVESISFYSDEDLIKFGIDTELNHPQYVKAGAVLEDIELFDAAFFGFNPREAEIIDPQHRLFLECAWEALEDAGYSTDYQGVIGVYAGASTNSYLFNLYTNPSIRNSVDNYQLFLASDKDFLTTRVSYKLNLEGPSVNIQTACSTSLVAVHIACQSLLGGECDIALAGGVSISKEVGYLYQEGGIYSPDGHCRAFDVKAQGTVGGSGLGVVVLKTLENALNDGDCIHAVIKGSAINNDGAFKVSYTAPRIDSQAKAIRAAQIMAEVDPETITYIEAHGTGTPLGDPIEITALTQAFRASTQKKGFCAIGSVKTNIGHLDATAGIASLIKTVLALKHKQIPSSLHFHEPNPQIDFANSPFYVNTTLTEWKANGTPRRAGVSSFGIGGTNAHVILEEAPAIKPSGSSRPWQLLLLSAKTNSALDTATANLAAHIQNHELNLADIAYTLQVGRRTFNYRRMLVCQSPEDAVNALETLEPERVLTQFQESGNQSVVFMFPGLETQYAMGWELYQVEPIFQKQVDLCCELLKPHLCLDLRHILYPAQEKVTAAIEQLESYIAQPALFAIEYALAQLFMSWGIRPVAMLGHNVGEYVAACLAGVFSLEDALRLVTAYGRLLQPAPFIEEVKKVKLNPPQIPLVSNLTGTWMTATEATSPTYWAAPRQTVRLAAGIAELAKPNRILLLLGPGHTLSTFAKQHLNLAATQLVLCSLPNPKEQSDVACLLSALGKLWLAGVEINWHSFYIHERRHRIPLPTYPFERQRYWIEPQDTNVISQEQLQIKPNIADWFYIPSWERDLLQTASKDEKLAQSCWLVFIDECGVGAQIAQRLEKAGQDAIAVTVGEQFTRISDRAFAINPQRRDDYDALLQALAEQNLTPNQIAHMWGITIPSSQSGISEFEKYQAQCFYSLLFLVQALAKKIATLQITVVTNNIYDVIGQEELIPEKVTVLGLCKVISQEYPGITCRSIDVIISESQKGRLIDQLLTEFTAPDTNLVIAYRGQHRWLQKFKAIHLDEAIKEMRLREGKTYLVVGELVEGIGIVIIEHLAQIAHSKLILIGESLPERKEWQEWLVTHEKDKISHTIRIIQDLEKAGTEFLVIKADVTNTDQMQAAINQAYEHFSQIHGVFYSTPMSNEKSAALIQQLNINQCEWNFKSKVHGLYVLAEVLQGRQIDFYFLQSSLSCVLGGLGLAAYSAANLFVDAFANQQNQTSSATWFSVNWDATRAEAEEKKVGFGASLAELAMTSQEIWNASRRILAMNSPGQVIVSKGDLQARIDEWSKRVSSQKLEHSEQGSSSSHSRPKLPNEYVAPRNEIEQIVANIWQELLGIEQLGVYDDFFELGGHSLLAVQMISRLRETFQVELPMRSILFDAHNVAGLASIITENQPKQEELQEIAELLKEVKKLSPEEIQQQLSVDN